MVLRWFLIGFFIGLPIPFLTVSIEAFVVSLIVSFFGLIWVSKYV